MLHIQDVPNFTYILIHTGNTDEHTSGCLIVGETQQDLEISKDGFIGSSTVAYKKMYAKVANQLLQGKKVTIEYTTINNLLENKPTVDNKAKDHTVLASTVFEKLQEINGNVIKTNAMLKGRLIQ
jgi:RNase P/RNase MRP subunit p29